MSEIKQPLVPDISFPDQLATDAEKATPEWGLRIGQAIQYQWFDKQSGGCRFYDQWTHYHRLRLYARGEQPIGKYKDRMAINGDNSKLNLDWTPVPIAEKFVDIVVNGMSEKMFTPRAYSQDAGSAEKRNSYQKNIEMDMIAEPFLTQTLDEFGIDAFNVPKDDLPVNDQELQLHMQLKYKPAIEIAEETAITTVMDMNDFNDTIRWKFNYDVTTCGIGAVKHRYSYSEGIKIEYVDVANLIYSYTEDPYFKDVFYWGEVKQVPILELKNINPNLTDEDIQRISKLSSSWADEYRVGNPYHNDIFQRDTVTLMYFNYKTDKKFIHKKKNLSNGGSRVIRRDENFMPPEDIDAPFEKLEKKDDVWYDGVMVLGTNELIKWELMENMVKPDSTFQQVRSNYVAVAPRTYKGRVRSILERMIPFVDMIQLTHLKMQQVQAKVVPDGIFLDADGFADISLGNGGRYTPQDAVDMYMATGSVVGRSYTSDGDYNQAKSPIVELNHSSGQTKMTSLIQNYNHYLNMIRDVTGLNEARDASTPDKDALVGLQKLAALNSNVATRHIKDAGLYMVKDLSESLSVRISDVLEYSDDKEELANQIGKYNVAMLEEIKNLYLHSFGIFIEVAPDEEEKAQLESNITTALDKGKIELPDAMDIRETRNIKLANELLKLKQKQKRQADIDLEEQKAEQQAAYNNQSQAAAAEAKQLELQAEAQTKIAVVNASSQGKIAALEKEAELQSRLMAEKHAYEMELATVTSNELMKRETEKEDRKDYRTKIQATQQSKMKQQAQTHQLPTNFESGLDVTDSGGVEQLI